MKILNWLVVFILLFVFLISAQEPGIHWKREQPQQKSELDIFHSTQAFNFPTAEILKKGEFEYEILHRFLPNLGEKGAYFGIDGQAQIRMALAYAFTNQMLVTVGRSNYNDNVDLNLKYRILQLPVANMPMAFAMRAGVAWTSAEIDTSRDKFDSRNFQYYGQLIFNTLLFKKIGIGIVPSYLYNSHVECKDTEYSFTVGGYLQYYAFPMMSLIAEGNAAVTGYRGKYNSFAFGIELETGGHFFKILLGDNSSMNPSHYLAGSPRHDWRLGFNITRVLKF